MAFAFLVKFSIWNDENDSSQIGFGVSMQLIHE